MTFALSVPANLLLLGEYAVTEEGGLGIALASAPRVELRVSSRGPRSGSLGSASLAIGGRMGPTSFIWVEGESADPAPALVAACLDEARKVLADKSLPAARIDIDSSAFFSAEGKKRGFGSSAAVAVGLSAALLKLGGLDGEALEAAVFPLALAAHRRAQGGRGSGYDVAASRFGGAGIFAGGSSPRWTAVPAELLSTLGELDLALRPGSQPVSSPTSVGAYQRWKAKDSDAHRAFLSASAGIIDDFITARTSETILAVLRRAAAAGTELGDAIGVPARPPGTLGPVEKCLGAGDELILVASARGWGPLSARPDILPLRIEKEGLRWE